MSYIHLPMRKTLLIFAIVAVNMMVLRAQVLTIDESYHNVTLLATEFSDAASYVQNNSSGPIKIKWTRFADVEPMGWTSTVCDDLNCYAPSIGAAPSIVTIPAGEKGLLKLNLFPNEVVGTGHYHVVAYDIMDSANVNVTMSVDVTAQANTGINDIGDAVISVYPNPAKDLLFVNLDVTKHISSLEIYNVVGQKVKTVNLEDGLKSVSVPVSDIKKGVYFLRVVSGTKEIVTRTFSKD